MRVSTDKPRPAMCIWYSDAGNQVSLAFLKLYFGDIVIRGLEHLPESGSVVLAPKHFSRWDPVVLASLSNEPLRFMTNANQFEGFQGWLIQRLGAFPIDLNHPKVSSFRCAIELLQAGKKLVIFPEGESFATNFYDL